jgi:hypothetical protein
MPHIFRREGVLMTAIRRIRVWWNRLVYRKADLLEIFSGATTSMFIAIVWFKHGQADLIPSMSLLAQTAPDEVWFTVFGILAVLQPVALHWDDPTDPRHPIAQPTKWLRALTAGGVGVWYAILFTSMWSKIGVSHVHAMYGMVLFMNGYIVAHVMFRTRD